MTVATPNGQRNPWLAVYGHVQTGKRMLWDAVEGMQTADCGR